MLGNGHVRFGRRAAETDQPKDWHRAAARPHTYVPTWAGMAFTAFVTDVFSRRIVGWRTAASMPAGLPLDAPEMALWTRTSAGQSAAGVVHHSDAGSQYTSIRYSARLAGAGALASIGTVGDSYDNALAESAIGLYKTECTQPEGPWRGADDLELATLDWVSWFNTTRLHSSIGYVPPIEFENKYHRQINPPAAAAAGRTRPPLNPERFRFVRCAGQHGSGGEGRALSAWRSLTSA